MNTDQGKHNEGEKFAPEIYKRSEIEALMAACSTTTSTGIRSSAMIATLYRTGLRIFELLALMPADIDTARGTVHVKRGKGGRSRIVGIDLDALRIMLPWTERRSALGYNGRHRLFCTLQGKPMSTAYVRQLLPRLGKKAGLDQRVHAHGFRHTLASELVEDGVPLTTIQQILGHKKASTTSEYLMHVNPKAAIEAMRSRRWYDSKEDGHNEEDVRRTTELGHKGIRQALEESVMELSRDIGRQFDEEEVSRLVKLYYKGVRRFDEEEMRGVIQDVLNEMLSNTPQQKSPVD